MSVLSGIKENGKGMLEEGAIYAAGGALIGLILDKFLPTTETSGSYEFTKFGILIGGVVGASAAAHTNVVTEAITNRKAVVAQ